MIMKNLPKLFGVFAIFTAWMLFFCTACDLFVVNDNKSGGGYSGGGNTPGDNTSGGNTPAGGGGNIAVLNVLLDKYSLTIAANKTAKLVLNFNPLNATNKAVTWTSSDEEVAKVDNFGNVTGVSVGTARISVTSADGGKTATCTVTVLEAGIIVVANETDWNNAKTTINNGSNSEYIIHISGNVSVSGSSSATFSGTGKTITLQGSTALGGGIFTSGTLALKSYGSSLIYIRNGQTVILDNGITLQGWKKGQSNGTTGGSPNDNNAPLVRVGDKYAADSNFFIMNDGSKITGNTFMSSSSSSNPGGGGGVYVDVNGSFTMNGGEISGNTVSLNHQGYARGGGVYVENGASFTMNGGEISGNTALDDYKNHTAQDSAHSWGGGVYVNNGTFAMNGGEISGNRAYAVPGYVTNSTSIPPHVGVGLGGGVYIDGGTFTMKGGTISGNSAYVPGSSSTTVTAFGGGVYMRNGTFRIVSGTIYGSDEGTLSNTVRNKTTDNPIYSGRALYFSDCDSQEIKYEYGTFNGETWNGTALGTWKNMVDNKPDAYIDYTLKVENGTVTLKGTYQGT